MKRVNLFKGLKEIPECVFVFILFFLSLFLFLLNNLHEGVGINEAITLSLIKLDISGLLSQLPQASPDTQLPFYYLFLKGISFFVGYNNVFILRCLSALLGSLFILCFYFFSKTIVNRKTALVASFILLFNPLLIAYTREISMYTMTALFAIANLYSFYFLLNLYCDHSKMRTIHMVRKYWILYFLSGILGIYTHYFFINTLFINFVYIIYLLIIQKENLKKLKEAIIVFSILNTIFICSYIPWLPQAVKHLEFIVNTIDWEQMSVSIILRILGFPFTSKYGYDTNIIPSFVIVIFFIIITYLLFMLLRKKRISKAMVFVIISFVFPLVTLFISSLLFSTTLFINSYFIFFPFFFLFIIYNIFQVDQKFLKLFLLFLIMGVFSTSALKIYTHRFNGEADTLFSYVTNIVNKEEPLFMFDENIALLAAVSKEEFPMDVYIVKKSEREKETAKFWGNDSDRQIKIINPGDFYELVHTYDGFCIILSNHPVPDIEDIFDFILSHNYILDKELSKKVFTTDYSSISFKIYKFKIKDNVSGDL
ncbi:MAG: glycosyltransferase family 39 protein [Spirochaetales bacterium]|nr:glycosyltransferase family 39 protein [Spirochaetales bacterium]